MDAYSKLLTDPKWQRKRLEIMQRDDFTCVRCSATTVTLNVHHKKYKYGRAPWEYDDSELETLCEICHKKEHGKSSKPAPQGESIVIPFNPALYTDPVRASGIQKEIELLQGRLKKEEAGQNNFATVAFLVGQINELVKEKQTLRRIR